MPFAVSIAVSGAGEGNDAIGGIFGLQFYRMIAIITLAKPIAIGFFVGPSVSLIGLISIDANFRLWPNRPRESRAPDLSFILKGRLPQDLTRFLPMAPDLAIEILSPDDAFARVMEKVEAYLQQGVQIVWIVIPDTREVLVCTSQGKYSVRDRLTAPELLPGFELQVPEIFAGLEMKAAR